MARIRTIKPETPKDELLGSLPREVRLLYVYLWTLVDDDGRFRSSPALIRAELFPYDDDLTNDQVADWLAILAETGRVFLYEANGQQYGSVVRFPDHQRIDHPTKSRLPEPPAAYRKKPIPNHVRREVARRAGCAPGLDVTAYCHYCKAPGSIRWWSASLTGWVSFSGLELDHVQPEVAGGQADADNIVLACRRCNRSKGAKPPENFDPAKVSREGLANPSRDFASVPVGIGREGKGVEGSRPVSGTGPSESKPVQPALPSTAPPTPEEIQELWNTTVRDKLPQVRELTEQRRKHLRSRSRPSRDLGWWRSLFERVLESPFLRGESDRGWRASFDFVTRSEESIVKILEGTYARGSPVNASSRAAPAAVRDPNLYPRFKPDGGA